ncbi:MAG: adenosylcobalamin-dependent ribonucleoside-diphosphate reductase [Bacteroidales bacterium]|nr:adenosylcobalamin-dependent ribonucleoside-diphosphate reductase [Bacteroidales bacterium]
MAEKDEKDEILSKGKKKSENFYNEIAKKRKRPILPEEQLDIFGLKDVLISDADNPDTVKLLSENASQKEPSIITKTVSQKVEEDIEQDVIKSQIQSENIIPEVVEEEINAYTSTPNLPIYKKEDVFALSLKYFKGDELAANVWINKYALKDSEGNLCERTPDDMHWRIANEIARIEKRYKNPLSAGEIFELLKDFKYIIPQGSPMAGIGNNFQIGSLSNCFVIGNNGLSDSYGGILKVDEEQVQLMKRRGGVGHDLSGIRPKGSKVLNSALTSTGLVPFMERYSNSTREVAQDGRRGALMLSVSIKHPDSENFIDAKMVEGKVTGANVSVRIDDNFMRAAINNTTYNQAYPVDSDNPKYVKEINAKELWDKIVFNAWKSAEPGILFWDTIARESVPDCYADKGFKTTSTNPCGEIPLCPYDSCRLLAINLYSYIKYPFTKEAFFDEDLFVKHVSYAQRIMDDIIDLELEKVDRILDKIKSDPEGDEIKAREMSLWNKIRNKCIEGRRTGIGITAEGDMLAALGLRYGTSDATMFSTEVHKKLAIEAYKSSVYLAYERGAFPLYDSEKEKNNPFILRLKNEDPQLYNDMVKFGRRNIALLTVAPTGSVSLMTQTTSGIEPAFSIFYKRRRKVNPNESDVNVTFTDKNGDHWEEFYVFHHKFIEWLIANGYNSDEVKSLPEEELQEIIKVSPYHKATANDVNWVEKVKMQGSVQKWVDHSISVTVNVPEDISVDLVGKIYQTAWEEGCKGITVYRDGSRSGVLVTDKKQTEKTCFSETNAPQRPKVLDAVIMRFKNNKESWIAVVGLYENRPYEIFTGLETDLALPSQVEEVHVLKIKTDKGSRYDIEYVDKDGFKGYIQGLNRTFKEEYWNYARLISGILRHGMPLASVVNIISNLKMEDETMNTWKKGVERALRKLIPDGTKAIKTHCENCGSDSLVFQEGCLTCSNCGFSKCN